MKTWQKVLLVVGTGGITALLLKSLTTPPAPPPPPPKKKTEMIVTEVPPSSGPVGTHYLFGGYLVDEDGNVLAGKVIKEYEIYKGTIIGQGETNYSEGWEWSVLIKYTGVTTVYCEFPGDADYEGSVTEMYDVVGT